MNTRTLSLQFLDTWHVGTGQGEGSHLDAVTARDADGLPYVPGRMLRGLLRDAVEALVAWGHVPASDALELLGGLAQRTDAPGRSMSTAGCLYVSDALLPAAERRVLAADSAHPAAPAMRAALYVANFQTAIDPVTSTAAEGSLRSIELVVPLTLDSELCIERPAARAAVLWGHLNRALPLVRGIGAMKTRGHGRVTLSWQGDAR